MKTTLAFLMLLSLAGCGDARDPDPVDAHLFYDPAAEPSLVCPGADHAFLEADALDGDPVAIGRCYWSCATWTDGGLLESGALLLMVYDAAPAWEPDDFRIASLQNERCE